MNDDRASLRLDVAQRADVIVVQLIGHSPRDQAVDYVLEVTGRSTSRHRGRTTLAADTPAILSTVRIKAGDDWCVRLVAEEDGRARYELSEGPCEGEAGDDQ